MTVSIVHSLKVIDVQHEAGEIVLMPERLSEKFFTFGLEGFSCKNACQTVGRCGLKQFDAIHRQSRQFLKNSQIFWPERLRPAINGTDGSQGKPLSRLKRHTSIETDMGFASH